MGHVAITTHLFGIVCHPVVYTSYSLPVKTAALAMPQMTGVREFNMCHMTLTMPTLEIACHPKANTTYDQPTHKI